MDCRVLTVYILHTRCRREGAGITCKRMFIIMLAPQTISQKIISKDLMERK